MGLASTLVGIYNGLTWDLLYINGKKMGLASTLVGIYNGLTWDLLLVSSLMILQCRNYKCDFFLEFRTNMYMVG